MNDVPNDPLLDDTLRQPPADSDGQGNRPQMQKSVPSAALGMEGDSPMEIDRNYILVALVLAVVGMLQGLYLGIAADNSLQSMHVALLLPGFVTLAIYGFIFRLWPNLKKSPLAPAQFWVGVLGSVGLVIGAYFFARYGSVPLAAIASIVVIIGVAMLTWMFWTNKETAR
jgi:hypothetical protein